MAFDFGAKLLGDDGELDEDAAEAYTTELLRLFAGSPEGQSAPRAGFVRLVVRYGLTHVGVTPAAMRAKDLSELLYEVFPGKISCDANEAPRIVAELRAYFAFAKRELAFAHADECLEVLGSTAEREIHDALADRQRWGMAKTMFMMGRESGFDMTTEQGLKDWMASYNAGLARDTARSLEPLQVPGSAPRGDVRRVREDRRQKRKLQKAARRRSR